MDTLVVNHYDKAHPPPHHGETKLSPGGILVITAGTEMRHDHNFRLTHQAVAVEKALGKLCGGRVSFCIASMFHTKPINPQNADDLVRNWQNWVALSGDQLVEQHVRNIDIANWFCGRPPVSAVGFGGRAQRRAATCTTSSTSTTITAMKCMSIRYAAR